jgi:hypothetical protein
MELILLAAGVALFAIVAALSGSRLARQAVIGVGVLTVAALLAIWFLLRPA